MVDQFPAPSDLILVAYLPNPRDLEIARVLGWYRIPLRTAPKVISVDYLAFYQPSSFGGDKWRIRTLARVLGHELVTRAELLQDQYDHPKAHEEYFKIQLGPLIKLPHEIMAEKWKRITFFYTTGDYISRAKTIADLIVQPEDRKLIWHALREKANQSQLYSNQEIPEIDLDSNIIAKLLGIQDLIGDYET